MKTAKRTAQMQATDKQQQQTSRDAVIKEAMKRRISYRGNDRGQEVLNALVETIEAAGLKVGDRFPPEKELAQSLGIGRSSIREALMAWQRMGIVVRNKGAGTRLVAEVNSRSLHLPLTVQVEAEGLMRTLAVRRPLEFEATRLAVLNGSEKDMRIINARCEELLAIYEAGENWHEADARFHAAIHDASGNPLFGQLIRQLHAAFHDTYEAPFDKPQMADHSIPIHRDLADAILARDWEAAEKVLQKIFAIVEAEVAKILNES
jgi:DNA-binding FadR family transcriptional regulator